MIDRNENRSIEEPAPEKDRAVADFRKKIEMKQEENEKRGKHSAFYGLTASVAAATLILALSYTDIGDRIAGLFDRDTGQETESEPEQNTVPVDGESILTVTSDEPSEVTQEPENPQPSPELSASPSPSPEPSATPAASTEYTVKKGDTLSKICREYYGNLQRLDEICRLNGMDAEAVIYPGQKIILPQ